MAWAPLLEEAQEHLCDLIGTFYLFWLDGPSQTAQAFRADEEEDEEPLDEEITIALQDVRHTIEQLVGAEPRIISACRAASSSGSALPGRDQPVPLEWGTACTVSIIVEHT